MTLSSVTHKDLLLNLISFSGSVSELTDRLSAVSWDQPEELITLNFFHVKKSIERFLNDEINSDELEAWANLIEAREDIGLEDARVEEAIYRLANPALEGAVNVYNCNEILALAAEKQRGAD